MPIDDYKFTESDFTGQKVADLPDRPKDAGLDAAAVKARFDNIGKVMIALGKHTGLINFLKGTTAGDSGAHNIGSASISGVTGTTVWAQISDLKAQLTAAIIGTFPGGSITNDMLGSDVKVGSLASLATTIKTNVVNAINELVTSINLKENRKITFVTDTASRTFALTDRYKWVKANHATVAINYTVPPSADVAWEEGDWIIIDQIGAAQAAVVAGTGVTFRPADKLKVNGQNTQMVLTYDGNDVWCVGGSRKA